jgi:hypothetical protein
VRGYLSQLAGSSLLSWIICGCQAAPTDLRSEHSGGEPQASVRPVSQADSGHGRNLHFVSNGESGEVFWSSKGGAPGDSIQGELSVSRGGPVNHPQVFLFYEVDECTSEGCSALAAGGGTVPAKDLSRSSNLKSLSFSTNTNNDPDFTIFVGTGGLVSAKWVNNSLFESRLHANSVTTSGNVTERIVGNITNTSATATGSVVGFAVGATQFADFGIAHSVTLDISRK